MRPAVALLVLVAALAGLLYVSMAGAEEGNGATEVSRFPWKDGTSVTLTQGWFGCSPSHCNPGTQYAMDWGGSFEVIMVSEGDATCVTGGAPFGNSILVERSDGIGDDRYAHLAACPAGLPKHVEQGEDLNAISSNTGCPGCGLHLHFHVENGGANFPHALSGIGDFCDKVDPDNGCYTAHRGTPYKSDNAGPGDATPDVDPPKTPIYTAYTNLGHFLCPPATPDGPKRAWDCFGSSTNVSGEGRKAVEQCFGTPDDCGWNQQFKDQSGALHNFSWAEACSVAAWTPDQFYITWGQNADALGFPRSQFLVLAGGVFKLQYFRDGFMYQFLNFPIQVALGGPNGCVP